MPDHPSAARGGPIPLIPHQLPQPCGAPPLVDRLALIGAPAAEIGTPIFAISDVDVDGFGVLKGDELYRSRADRNRGSIGMALVASGILGTLLGGAAFIGIGIALVEAGAPESAIPPVGGVVWLGLVWILFMGFRRLFGAERRGRSIVVGNQGFQLGRLSGADTELVVIRYDDPSHRWFERRENVHVVSRHDARRAAPRGAPTFVVEQLSIRSGRELATELEERFEYEGRRGDLPLDGRITPLERIAREHTQAMWAIQDHGRAARIQAALRRLARGERIELPIGSFSRTLTLIPASAGPTDVVVEVRTGDRVELRAPLTALHVSVERGVYRISAGGATVSFERDTLGDAIVFDAVLSRTAQP